MELFEVQTNQTRFQRERSREKRTNSLERATRGNWLICLGL